MHINFDLCSDDNHSLADVSAIQTLSHSCTCTDIQAIHPKTFYLVIIVVSKSEMFLVHLVLLLSHLRMQIYC